MSTAVLAVIGPMHAIRLEDSCVLSSSSKFTRFLTVEELVKVTTSIPSLINCLALSEMPSGVIVR